MRWLPSMDSKQMSTGACIPTRARGCIRSAGPSCCGIHQCKEREARSSSKHILPRKARHGLPSLVDPMRGGRVCLQSRCPDANYEAAAGARWDHSGSFVNPLASVIVCQHLLACDRLSRIVCAHALLGGAQRQQRPGGLLGASAALACADA